MYHKSHTNKIFKRTNQSDWFCLHIVSELTNILGLTTVNVLITDKSIYLDWSTPCKGLYRNKLL